MSSYRSWSNTNTPAPAPAANEGEQPSNPFGNMRREKERNQSYGMSYSDWKGVEQKKKVEAEKSRPLTDADFPPLGGKVVIKTSMHTTTAHDSIPLAERLRNTIKRQEDDAHRRRLELEEEEKKTKEAIVSISLTSSSLRNRMREITLRRNLEAQAEEDYAWQVSTETEAEAPAQ
jgi:hypothetical protein